MKAKFRKRLNSDPPVAVEKVVIEPVIDSSDHPWFPVHPGRYPTHGDREKGQVYDGVCNVTRCDNHHATMWNLFTMGFYCMTCARAINYRERICVAVEKKPSLMEMDDLRAKFEGFK